MDTAFDSIRNRMVLETKSEDFLNVLEAGSVSPNV